MGGTFLDAQWDLRIPQKGHRRKRLSQDSQEQRMEMHKWLQSRTGFEKVVTLPRISGVCSRHLCRIYDVRVVYTSIRTWMSGTVNRDIRPIAALATQGQMDGFFSQLLYKCYLEEVASVGD